MKKTLNARYWLLLLILIVCSNLIANDVVFVTEADGLIHRLQYVAPSGVPPLKVVFSGIRENVENNTYETEIIVGEYDPLDQQNDHWSVTSFPYSAQ